MTANMKRLAGVLPVFQLPYLSDESIDYDTLGTQLDWLYQRGADGVVMAMVSEVLRLSGQERQAVAQYVCEHPAAGRGVAIISVGAESSYVACELARQAEAVGADAVMAIPPVSIGLDDDQTCAYYRRILEAVNIPVIVQDASGYVGRPMSIGVQARLLDQFGQQVLFKPEATPIGPRLSALRDATAGKARVFEGTGGLALVDSYRRGIVGTMPGADLIDGIVALWRALQADDQARVDTLAGPICALVSMQSGLDAFLAIEKHLLVRQGVFKNTLVRGPVGYVLDEETRQEVDRLFDLVQQAVEQTS